MAEDNFRKELSTWQEIAGYLGVSYRTAQNWHRDRGLPVRRLAGRVVAFSAELDEWKKQQIQPAPQPEHNGHHPPPNPEASSNVVPAPPLELKAEPTETAGIENTPSTKKRTTTLLIAAAVMLTAIASLIVYRIYRPRPEPSHFIIEGRLLTVFDDHNNRLWNYALPAVYSQSKMVSTLAPLLQKHKFLSTGAQRGDLVVGILDTVYCFKSDGSVRWKHKPGREVLFRSGRSASAEYAVSLVGVLGRPRPDGGQIVVGASQGPSALYVVELLTKDGRKVGEYFHGGWFSALTIGAFGQGAEESVFLAGVDDTPRAPEGFRVTLVVLDPNRVEGQAVTYAGALQGLPVGREKAALLFQEFEPNPRPHDYCRPQHLWFESEKYLQIHVTQSHPESSPYAYYRFDPLLRLERIMPDIALRKLLESTILKGIPSEKEQTILLEKLGKVLYLKNEFTK